MHITREWLEARWACSNEVAIFDAEWPDGVDVNLETLLRAARLGLNLSWLARHVLKEALWVEYERQADPFMVEYERRVAPLRAEFERQEAPLWAEFERQEAPLWAEFERQVAPILWEFIQSQEAQGQ